MATVRRSQLPRLALATALVSSLFVACAKKQPAAGTAPLPTPHCTTPGVIPLGPTPLRRLSHVEYAKTVTDLFAGIQLPLPDLAPDRAVSGFKNNAAAQSPSPLLTEEYVSAARDIAAAAVAAPDKLLSCHGTELTDPLVCGQQFIAAFAPRVFRKAPGGDEVGRYQQFFQTQLQTSNFNVALQLTIEALLLSPQFLYRLELTPTVPNANTRLALGPYEMASRLSYFLWETMPDAQLLAAAAAGQLETVDQVTAQARRMLADARSHDAVVDFHRQWLDFDTLAITSKDPATFPQFTDELRASMQEETERFIASVIFERDGKLSTLLTSPRTMVNQSLAGVYGVPGPADSTSWTETYLSPNQRAGLLTQASFLASHAHAVNPSPVKRGVFVLDRLLCSAPPPPAANVNTTPPTQQSDQPASTNRQRYEQHLTNATCAACHAPIDGVGFTFESFDSIGQYRTTDNNLPVDASGQLVRTDSDGPVNGAVELSKKLAESPQVQRCVATQWFRYAFGRVETDEDACSLDHVNNAFSEGQQDIRELLVAVVASDAFRFRLAATTTEGP